MARLRPSWLRGGMMRGVGVLATGALALSGVAGVAYALDADNEGGNKVGTAIKNIAKAGVDDEGSFVVDIADLAPGKYVAWVRVFEKGTAGYLSALDSNLLTVIPEPALEVTPKAPVLVPAEDCGVAATVDVPEMTGVEYFTNQVGTLVTITAVPADGYTIADGATTTWVLDVAPKSCPVGPGIVTPKAPVLVPAEDCGVAATVDVPEMTGVEYTSVEDGYKVTVTAVAADDYALAEGAVTEWTFDTTPTACPVNPEKPGAAKPGAGEAGGGLASTGATGGVAAAAALMLLGGGAFLALRRKGA